MDPKYEYYKLFQEESKASRRRSKGVSFDTKYVHESFDYAEVRRAFTPRQHRPPRVVRWPSSRRRYSSRDGDDNDDEDEDADDDDYDRIVVALPPSLSVDGRRRRREQR